VTTKGDSLPAFLGWCLAGAAGCFGVLSLLTVGPFVLLATLFFSAWLLWSFGFGWAMGGLLTGAALPVLYVAWLNRDGPGQVCSSTATSQTCTDEWSPWPFVGAAIVLTVAGVVVLLRRPHSPHR
jgi:hypothetical protein